MRFHYDAPDDGPVIGIKRYNPFELALYGRWAKDTENPPTVSEIKDPESDPYVAARLVGPLQDEVLERARADRSHARSLRPRGRVGRQRPCTGPLRRRLPVARGVGVDRRAARRLVRGPAALRPRIRRHLETSGPQQYRRRRRALLERLGEYVEDCPLDALDHSHLAAMARLLGEDPAAAWAWWRGVEKRFAGCGTGCARELTGLLLEAHDPDAAADPASALLDPLPDAVAGYVRATYAATLGQVSLTADTATEWAAVEAWVEEHADAPGAAVLRLRARAGAIAGTPAPLVLVGQEAMAELVEAVRGVPQGELGESLAAAAADRGDGGHRPELARRKLAALPAFADLLEAVLSANPSAPLEAFARSLRARVQLRSVRPGGGIGRVERAIALQRPRATRAT